jgi:hypothetical protein
MPKNGQWPERYLRHLHTIVGKARGLARENRGEGGSAVSHTCFGHLGGDDTQRLDSKSRGVAPATAPTMIGADIETGGLHLKKRLRLSHKHGPPHTSLSARAHIGSPSAARHSGVRDSYCRVALAGLGSEAREIACRGTYVVPIPKLGTRLVLQCPDVIGGCSRTRTCDPLIKSQLLYQLSYAPGASCGL